MAQSTAHRRLLQEYRALTNNPPEGITAGPVSEDDLLHWEALIQGPEGTPFEGGIFPAELRFPKDYPLAPPTMKFLGEIWHPNGTSSPVSPFSLPLPPSHTIPPSSPR
jgi:ubiquitin-conjugating enzyme E2 G2